MLLRDDPLAHIGTCDYGNGRVYQVLVFTCPADGCGIRVPFTRDEAFEFPDPTAEDGKRHVWKAIGEFPDITLIPSVHVKEGPKDNRRTHWHGHVTNGATT